MYPHFNINDKSFNENNENIFDQNEIMQKIWKFSKVHKVRKSLKNCPNLEIVQLATETYSQGFPNKIKDI